MTFHDASSAEHALIESLVGRALAGRFAVVVRRADGRPVVIENEPHLRDGTPMPTLFWLVDPEWHDAVSRLEGNGGVHRYEQRVDAVALAATHEAYAEKRRAATLRHEGAQPSGGVGGTRVGVKCLHAHLANYLTGADDPVGQLVAEELAVSDVVVVDVRR